MTSATDPSLLDAEIAAAEALCRDTLAGAFAGFCTSVPSAPANPEECFELLRRSTILETYATDPDAVARFRAMASEAEGAGISVPFAAERYTVLQACLVALPRLSAQQVDPATHLHFCATCRHVAALKADPPMEAGSDEFYELARIVSLQRVHAGQLSYEVRSIRPGEIIWWAARTNPLDYAALASELLAMGITGPIIQPHISFWRAKPQFILRKEQDRSLQQIAWKVKADETIKGLAGSAWLLAENLAEDNPHLAWMREMFLENNACIIDLGQVRPSNKAFLVGSARRRRAYESGTYRPRDGLLFWRRGDVLAWEKSYSSALTQTSPRAPSAAASQKRVSKRRRLESGRFTLFDCRGLLAKSVTRYLLITVIAPALAISLLASLYGFGPAIAAFLLVAGLMWISQYFLLQ